MLWHIAVPLTLLVSAASFAAPGSTISRVPVGFAAPPVPHDNPLTVEKVLAGRYLFYDKRLSVNGTRSCASCHQQQLAFTDGRARALGALGELHARGSMSLVNAAWNGSFNWSDPLVHSLEQQARRPLFSTRPVEMGFGSVEAQFLQAMRRDPVYRVIFPAAFPNERLPFTTANIVRALASFERTIVSADSPWDRFHFGGDDAAISESAKRGELLFFLDGPSCFRCHSGPDFSGTAFHNTGLYNLAGSFSYPADALGLYIFTGKRRDVGRFRAPTLRNIAITGPYMHDGSIVTLGEVLEHYASGGRTIAEGPMAGVGHQNPSKDRLIQGFRMTSQNRADLLAFLESLTDLALLNRNDLSDPWPSSPLPFKMER